MYGRVCGVEPVTILSYSGWGWRSRWSKFCIDAILERLDARSKMNSFNHRNPVLLVHGFNGTTAIFRTMSAYLASLGWQVYDLTLTPCNGDLGLEQLAQQVANYVAKTFTPSQPLDLIGFSMGGIVSRYYIQRLRGIEQVQRFITISSPHHGTWTAYALERPACIQMRPGSTFLHELNRDAAILEQLNFTSIWTPFDLMIVPANSSKMPVGREVQVPVLYHDWMPIDLRSLKAVVAALSELIKPEREAASPVENRQSVHSRNYQKLPTRDGNT